MLVLLAANVQGQNNTGKTYKLANNVYSFGLNDFYSMFVVTSNGVIAIEPANTVHAKAMLKAIKKVTQQPVKYLLISHNHWNHASGGQVFIAQGAKVVAHTEAYQWMKAHKYADMVLPNDIWAGNKKVISLGTTDIELHYLGINHGLGMTVFVLPKQKVAYIADLVSPNAVFFNIVPDFNIKEWERSLKNIIALDFNKAVFSHNSKKEAWKGGAKQDVRDILQFMQDIKAGIQQEYKKGTDPMKIASKLKLPKYKNWAMYDEWLEMNIWRFLIDDWIGPYPWKEGHQHQKRD